MTLTAILFIAGAVLLLAVVAWLLVRPLAAESALGPVVTSELEALSARHCRHLTQMRQALATDDRAFIDRRLPASAAKRVQLEKAQGSPKISVRDRGGFCTARQSGPRCRVTLARNRARPGSRKTLARIALPSVVSNLGGSPMGRWQPRNHRPHAAGGHRRRPRPRTRGAHDLDANSCCRTSHARRVGRVTRSFLQRNFPLPVALHFATSVAGTRDARSRKAIARTGTFLGKRDNLLPTACDNR